MPYYVCLPEWEAQQVKVAAAAILSFYHSFTHSFIHSLILLFTYSPIHPRKNPADPKISGAFNYVRGTEDVNPLLLHTVENSLESFRVVHCQVSKNFAVQANACFAEAVH